MHRHFCCLGICTTIVVSYVFSALRAFTSRCGFDSSQIFTTNFNIVQLWLQYLKRMLIPGVNWIKRTLRRSTHICFFSLTSCCISVTSISPTCTETHTNLTLLLAVFGLCCSAAGVRTLSPRYSGSLCVLVSECVLIKAYLTHWATEEKFPLYYSKTEHTHTWGRFNQIAHLSVSLLEICKENSLHSTATMWSNFCFMRVSVNET